MLHETPPPEEVRQTVVQAILSCHERVPHSRDQASLLEEPWHGRRPITLTHFQNCSAFARSVPCTLTTVRVQWRLLLRS